MRNFLYALLIVAILLGSILVIANWNKIMTWWNGPEETGLTCQEEYDAAQEEFTKSGEACILTSVDIACDMDPQFVRSVNPCVEKILQDKGWKSVNTNTDPANNPPPTVNNLRISNPNGAPMYYQNDLSSGGQSYSQSNVVLPQGMELVLVKVWPTNLTNQPLAGYYETNYKQYGDKSGFFDINDVSNF